MAKSTKTAKKIEEIQDFVKNLKAENIRQNPLEYDGKKVKCRFNTMICADYGTFMPGECGEIPEIRAKELEAFGKCEIITEKQAEGSGE